MARSKAQQNHAQLEQELQRRKEQARASTALPGVRVKEEPLSEEGEDEGPMDTSPSAGLHSRLANGLPAGRAAGGDSFNGHPPPGCAGGPVARELRAFVEATFQRQVVLTLSELKRLFNLHLAGLPPGHTLFSGISDRMLQDTVLAAGCKQILVPVSRASGRRRGRGGGTGPGRRLLSRLRGAVDRDLVTTVAAAPPAVGEPAWRVRTWTAGRGVSLGSREAVRDLGPAGLGPGRCGFAAQAAVCAAVTPSGSPAGPRQLCQL